MENTSTIGKEAKELDKKHISERVRVKRSSLKKVLIAIIFYSIMMFFFNIFI